MDEQNATNPNMCSSCASLLDNSPSSIGIEAVRDSGRENRIQLPINSPIAPVTGHDCRN